MCAEVAPVVRLYSHSNARAGLNRTFFQRSSTVVIGLQALQLEATYMLRT